MAKKPDFKLSHFMLVGTKLIEYKYFLFYHKCLDRHVCIIQMCIQIHFFRKSFMSFQS